MPGKSSARWYLLIVNTGSKLGGISLKPREIALVCCYTEEEINIAQIIQDSFETFLKKELCNVEKHLCAAV